MIHRLLPALGLWPAVLFAITATDLAPFSSSAQVQVLKDQLAPGQYTIHDREASPAGGSSVGGLRLSTAALRQKSGIDAACGNWQLKLALGLSEFKSPAGGACFFIAGFRDEGGAGRVVLLGFGHDAGGRPQFGLAGPDGKLFKPLDFLGWLDGQVHRYEFTQRSNAAGGMGIEITADGQILWQGENTVLPEDTGAGEGLVCWTSSPGKVRAVIANLDLSDPEAPWRPPFKGAGEGDDDPTLRPLSGRPVPGPFRIGFEAQRLSAAGWRLEGKLLPVASTVQAPVLAGPGRLSHPLTLADLGGNAFTSEWSFEARLRLSGEPAISSNRPCLEWGLRDEAGGKALVFRLFRTGADRWVLKTGDPNWKDGEKVLAPEGRISDAPRLVDGRFHTFRILKRFGLGTPSMRALFLVDGVRYTPLGFGFHYSNQLPDATTRDVGIEVAVHDPALKVEMDDLGWGRPEATRYTNHVPQPLAQIPVEKLGLDWLLTRNRHYMLRATVSNASAIVTKARLTIEQFRSGRSQAEFPPAELVLGTVPVSQSIQIQVPFFTWMASERVRVKSNPGLVWSAVTLQGGGPYEVETPIVTIDSAPPLTEAAKETLRQAKPYEAKVEVVGGRPRLLVNGQVVAPALYAATFGVAPRGHVREFAQAGIHAHAWHAIVGDSGWDGGIWKGKGNFDFSRLEQELWEVLAQDPLAMIQLMIWFDPYRAWGVENPDEVCRNDRGELAIGVNHLTRWGKPSTAKERYLPSLYSPRMLSDGQDLLRRLIAFLKERRLLGRIIGFGIIGFNDGQFVNWAHWERERMDDYSPCASNAYRAWLLRRYQGDAQVLRRAWGQPQVDFATVGIPSPERRRGNGLWHQDHEVADWNRFYIEGPIELMEGLARTAKEATGGQKICSVYFASALNAGLSGPGLGRVLASPWIDVMSCPAHYGPRLPGHSGGYQSAGASALLHQKLFISEQDWRSWRSASEGEIMDWSCGRAPDAWSMAQMIRRESGMMLAHGQGTWWLELVPSAFSDPAIMATVAEASRAYQADLVAVQAPEADMAIFLGERSINYLANSAHAVDYRWQVLRHQRDQWNLSGVPYHVYNQADLASPKLPAYRLYIFISPEVMSASELTALQSLRSDGKTLVFLHAPNTICPDPAAGILASTGMVAVPVGNRRHAGTWLASHHALLRGFAAGEALLPRGFSGLGGANPLEFEGWAIKDAQATALATFAGSEDTCVAVRDFGTHKVVLSTLPFLEATFIHNLALEAKAWCAIEPGDAVYANQNFFTIHACRPGHKVLTLRRPGRVVDLSDGKALGAKETLELDMSFGETRWFRIEP